MRFINPIISAIVIVLPAAAMTPTSLVPEKIIQPSIVAPPSPPNRVVTPLIAAPASNPSAWDLRDAWISIKDRIEGLISQTESSTSDGMVIASSDMAYRVRDIVGRFSKYMDDQSLVDFLNQKEGENLLRFMRAIHDNFDYKTKFRALELLGLVQMILLRNEMIDESLEAWKNNEFNNINVLIKRVTKSLSSEDETRFDNTRRLKGDLDGLASRVHQLGHSANKDSVHKVISLFLSEAMFIDIYNNANDFGNINRLVISLIGQPIHTNIEDLNPAILGMDRGALLAKLEQIQKQLEGEGVIQTSIIAPRKTSPPPSGSSGIPGVF